MEKILISPEYRMTKNANTLDSSRPAKHTTVHVWNFKFDCQKGFNFVKQIIIIYKGKPACTVQKKNQKRTSLIDCRHRYWKRLRGPTVFRSSCSFAKNIRQQLCFSHVDAVIIVSTGKVLLIKSNRIQEILYIYLRTTLMLAIIFMKFRYL